MELEVETIIEAEFFNLSSDLMVVMKKDRILLANEAWKTILGWNSEEVKGRSLADFIHPADLEMAFHIGKTIYNTGIDIHLENKYLTKDGYYKWISWKTFIKSGLILAVGKEITLAKEKEAEYKRINNFRDSLLANSRYLIISMEGNGIIKSFNKAAEVMLGYRAEEVVEKITPTIFFDKSELEERSKELSLKINQTVKYGYDYFLKKALYDMPNEHEWNLKRKDGSSIPLQLSVSAVKDEFNNINGFLIIGNDISQKIDAQKRLKESEAIFKAMNDACPLSVFLTDANGECIYTNKAFQDLIEVEEMISSDFFLNKIVHKDDFKKVKETWDAAIAEKKVFQKRFRIVSSSGSIKWVHTNTAFINEENESLLGYVGIIVDITKEIESKEQLQGTLTNLEKSNKSLDNFAYVVSHDLKAPLKSIAAMINFIEDDLNDGGIKAKEYLKLLMGRVCKMAEIIEEILDFSRIGSYALKKENIKVKQFVQELFEFISTGRQAKIELDIEDFEIFESKILVTQIFSNLISNAIKYNDKEECRIRISGKKTKDKYYFEVEDNGPGIPVEYHEKVFELFGTLRNEHVTDSTGIGLAIVKRIIEEELKGRIYIESMPGKGAKFVFSW